MLPLYKILDRKLSDCIAGSKDERFVNFFMAESFSERKGLLPARNGTRSWETQPKSPAAGLEGDNCVSTVLTLSGLFHTMSLGKKLIVSVSV